MISFSYPLTVLHSFLRFFGIVWPIGHYFSMEHHDLSVPGHFNGFANQAHFYRSFPLLISTSPHVFSQTTIIPAYSRGKLHRNISTGCFPTSPVLNPSFWHASFTLFVKYILIVQHLAIIRAFVVILRTFCRIKWILFLALVVWRARSKAVALF